jgi:shikimate kinase
MELIKPRNTVLFGFMGAGKTESGLLVAEQLVAEHCDTDQVFEERHGPIGNYLPGREAEFCDLESKIFREALAIRGIVISVGGRTFVNKFTGQSNCKFADEMNATRVWLKVGFYVAANRVRKDKKKIERPFFKELIAARKLFNERQSLYEHAARITIDANHPLEKVVPDILRALEQYWAES